MGCCNVVLLLWSWFTHGRAVVAIAAIAIAAAIGVARAAMLSVRAAAFRVRAAAGVFVVA